MKLTRRGDMVMRALTVLLTLALIFAITRAANHHGKSTLKPSNSSKPLGVRLQEQAGDAFEVIYDPKTGVYTVEPRGQAGITTK